MYDKLRYVTLRYMQVARTRFDHLQAVDLYSS